MSSDAKLIMQVIPYGRGIVLDLGGHRGLLRHSLQERGYNYINLDVQHFDNGEPSLIGDAHCLPFKNGTLDMVVSKDTLEHFIDPWLVVREIYRVLKVGGKFIVWVPFLHPFHENDFYRYSPLGLRRLLEHFEILSFDSPLWIFTLLGLVVMQLLKQMHLGFLERPMRQLCNSLDRLVTRQRRGPTSFASAYRIVAQKPSICKC